MYVHISQPFFSSFSSFGSFPLIHKLQLLQVNGAAILTLVWLTIIWHHLPSSSKYDRF
ncbi:hypothetical protein DL98DRAFT_513251 [Cadophora sp. DSE1049]|nr:hypothetical protein DL98DRAFT_513251 [Cadophora sp. DSE1049]